MTEVGTANDRIIAIDFYALTENEFELLKRMIEGVCVVEVGQAKLVLIPAPNGYERVVELEHGRWESRAVSEAWNICRYRQLGTIDLGKCGSTRHLYKK